MRTPLPQSILLLSRCLVPAAVMLFMSTGLAVADAALEDASERLMIDPEARLGRFEGFGGNFGFGLDDGVTERILSQLHPPVARIRMHLDNLLEPPAGADPHAAWLRMLIAADHPWTELWQCLEAAATIHRRRARIGLSTWRVPAWLLDKPIQHDQNEVPVRRHPAFAGMIAAYLDYLRLTRGVEPETFSFNEPDWGANVIFTADAYHDALLAVTEALRRRNLRTRLVIGDLASARNGSIYLAPVLADRTLMARASAIAFHAWGTATTTEYAAWRALADSLNLPLAVAEIGADPNWREVQLHGYDYALRELALYFDVLQHARPQRVLYWEYGSSYSLLPPGEAGNWQPESERLAFQRHWVNLTPADSETIACGNTPLNLAAAAFIFSQQGHDGLTIHLGNFSSERNLTIAGLPKSIERMRAVSTCEGAPFKRLTTIRFRSGEGRVTLPARGMLSLTTLKL